MRINYILLFISVGFMPFSSFAADLIPVQPIGDKLAEESREESRDNLSGAFFDGSNLWLVRNNEELPIVWKVVLNSDGKILEEKTWIIEEGDYEAITAVGVSSAGTNSCANSDLIAVENRLILLSENQPTLVQFTFDITAARKDDGRPDIVLTSEATWTLPYADDEDGVDGEGAEGLTWIPNGHYDGLQRTDGNGEICSPWANIETGDKYYDFIDCPTAPIDRLDGLFLVAHQDDGEIYAYWLPPSSTDEDAVLYGVYDTSEEESAGLEYDCVKRHLYIWHGDHENSLEIANLKIDPNSGKLELVGTPIPYPTRAPNLEGIALNPFVDPSVLFITEDSRKGPENLLRLEMPPLNP